MVQQIIEMCVYCGTELVFSPEESLIKCKNCGKTQEITRFENQYIRIQAALEEGEQARNSLVTATRERDYLQRKLKVVLTSFDETASSQDRTEKLLSEISSGLHEGKEAQNAVMEILQVIRQKTGDNKDFLGEYTRFLLEGQDDISDALSFLQDIAEKALSSQKDMRLPRQVQGEMLARISEMQIDEEKQDELTLKLMTWQRRLREEDLKQLEEIGEASKTIVTTLQNLETKVDALRETEEETQNILDDFSDQYSRDRLEKLNRLYHMAIQYQRARNFDQAEKYYQEVRLRENGETEVLWRELLCHYCIEYQKNDDGQYVPTILNPVLEDPAEMPLRNDLIEAARKQGKDHYIQELAVIDTILERYREVRWKNQCDVFISVKQDIDGQPTSDSKRAEDIYTFLTEKGLKVFNSRMTPPPAGEYYEPYIIAALMSAKVMVVIGSSAENLEARWVRNEWARYQWLQNKEYIKNGKSNRKLIVFLTGGMQPQQLPKALNPERQAILDNPKAKDQLLSALQYMITHKQAEVKSSSPGPILKQMGVWLRLGRFEQVSQKYQELLEKGEYQENVQIHLSEICAQNHIKSVSQLAESDLDLTVQPAYQYALKSCRSSEAQKELRELRWKNENWKLRQYAYSFAAKTGQNPDSAVKWNQIAKKEYGEQHYKEAAACYLKAAEMGNPKGQVNIGYMYEFGQGVAKDSEHAVVWYRMSAEKGNPHAQGNLGQCYESGNGVRKDAKLAFSWYTKAAQQGLARSQNDLGRCYGQGIGVERDYEQAVYWYEKAAEQDELNAIANLAWYYRYGKGVEKDENKAFLLYEKAAEGGLLRAQRLLAGCYSSGVGTERKEEKAVYWYEKAAERGDREAQNSLGLKYEKGQGVAKDDTMASYWYRKSAEQGYSYGQYNLASNYANGRGVEADEKQASYWYLKAAEGGHKTAQNNIGLRYEKGKGIEKNLQKAVYWYQKSAEQGYSNAQCNLGVCYEYGDGIEKNPEKAYYWYQKAADQDSARGIAYVGDCYRNGLGVEKDEKKALDLYLKAAEKGRSYAQYRLAKAYEEGRGTEKDLEKAVFWYQKAADQGDEDAAEALARLQP